MKITVQLHQQRSEKQSYANIQVGIKIGQTIINKPPHKSIPCMLCLFILYGILNFIKLEF